MARAHSLRHLIGLPAAVMTMLLALMGSVVHAQLPGFLPSDLEPITPANMHRVEQVAMLGTGTVTSLVWSPDGQTIAAAGSAGVRLLRADQLDAPPVWLLEHNGGVVGAWFSPDGSEIMTAGVDETVRRWDTATGQLLSVITPPVGETDRYNTGILSFDVSPDGQWVAIGRANAGLSLLNEAMDHVLLPLTGRAGMVTRFSSDGSLVVSLAFYDGMVSIWRVDGPSFELQQDIPVRNDNWGFALSPDNRRIAVAPHSQYGDYPGVQIFDTQTGEVLDQFDGERTVAIDPTGTLLATMSFTYRSEGASSIFLIVWNMDTHEQVASIPVTSAITQLSFSPDGTKLAAGLADGSVAVWSTAGRRLLSSVEGRGSRVVEVALLDDHLVSQEDGTVTIATPSDGGGPAANTLRLWDLNAGIELEAWERDEFEPALPLNAELAQIPNTAWFTLTRRDDPPFRHIWTPGQMNLVPFYSGRLYFGRFFQFNRAGDRMFTTGTTTEDGPQVIVVWEISSSGEGVQFDTEHVVRTEFSEGVLREWALHPTEPEVFGATNDGLMQVWNYETGEVVQSGQLAGRPNTVLYSADGAHVFVNDGQWQMLNADTLEPIAYLRGEQPGYLSSFLAAVNHSSSVLAFDDDGGIVLWDGVNDSATTRLPYHSALDLMFSPDDRLLISAGADGTIRFWGVRSE